MTDYDDKELSTDEGSPLEIYEFIGSYRSYYMTSDALPYTFASKVYSPAPGLKRGEIGAGTHEEDNVDLTIDVPILEQLVKDYGFQTTPPKLDVIIRRVHRGTTTVVSYWKGPIVSIIINGNMARLRSPSKFGTILQGNIPNVYVQPVCNNALFDGRCKVSRVSNSVDTSVTLVEDTNISVASIGAFTADPTFFKGGEIVVPGRNERRMIIAQAGTILTVNYPFASLVPGTAVQITAGCDHSYDGPNGCPKFNNKPNFGGTPFVPGESKNVFTQGLG